MSSSVEEDLVKLATELANERPDPQAPSYRDAHPYSTFRAGVGRPYSLWFIRAVLSTVTDEWEKERVARLVAATEGRRWSLVEAETILRRERPSNAVREIALDLLIHAYLATMA